MNKSVLVAGAAFGSIHLHKLYYTHATENNASVAKNQTRAHKFGKSWLSSYSYNFPFLFVRCNAVVVPDNDVIPQGDGSCKPNDTDKDEKPKKQRIGFKVRFHKFGLNYLCVTILLLLSLHEVNNEDLYRSLFSLAMPLTD